VVVHKGVEEEQLQLLFRHYPGCEYCDLKRDKATGKSKGYCYVNYSTPAAAAAAVADLNGLEYPPGSGCRLKVMFAEIMTGGGGGGAGVYANAAHSGSNNNMVAMLRSGSLGSAGRLASYGAAGVPLMGSLVRNGSSGNNLAMHQACSSSSSSGGMHSTPGSSSMTSAGPHAANITPMGGSSSLLSPASDPQSARTTAGSGTNNDHVLLRGSRGPSPAATPGSISQQQQQQQQQLQHAELMRVTDTLSSLSLPHMGAPSPQQQQAALGRQHSSDVAGQAAGAPPAVQQQCAPELSAAAGGNDNLSAVARELMFNLS
jgi:RNA recognition motif-containing protein